MSAFMKLSHKRKHVFLLESAEYAEQIGRYSIIGFDPKKIFIATETSSFTILTSNEKKVLHRKPFLDVLKSEID